MTAKQKQEGDGVALQDLEDRIATCEEGLIRSGHLVRLKSGKCVAPGDAGPAAEPDKPE
jgi:hypothetical protein